MQLVDSLVGTLDAPVLERLAKVLSFVRISGKNGKKLKRKDKLRMLEAMEQAQLGGPSNGSAAHAANGDSAQPPLPSYAQPASVTGLGSGLLCVPAVVCNHVGCTGAEPSCGYHGTAPCAGCTGTITTA